MPFLLIAAAFGAAYPSLAVVILIILVPVMLVWYPIIAWQDHKFNKESARRRAAKP